MPSHAPDPAARPEGYDHIGTTWEDAMRWCREHGHSDVFEWVCSGKVFRTCRHCGRNVST